jgi:NAD+ diphosphatase
MRTPNYYTSPGFERAGLRRRDTDWIRARAADAASVFVPVWRSRSLVVDGDDGPRALLVEAASLALDDVDGALARGELVFLGFDDGRAHFALDLSPHEAPLDRLSAALPALEGGGTAPRFADLRQLGGALGRGDAALLAHGRAMLTWHARHRFCGVCGSPTRAEEAGHMRRCTNPDCATMHFPRTDSAVIMLVTNGSQALLGRSRHFLPGMYSTLAGFLEPGESLEQAVAREVHEETGVVLGAVRYHSSQPWPFPSNIMLGFTAEAVTSEITIDYGELEDARWFERDWLRSHVDGDDFRLPRLDSIARRLIEDWLAADSA